MQIPILSGITSNPQADWRTSYPVNFVPVPKDTGISKGYLQAAPGLTQLGTGPGVDRGGMFAFDTLFRVMGTKLVTVAEDGTVTNVGDITGAGRVAMDYSFDYLAVVGDGKAWLCTSGAATQITDGDLGVPIDVIWIDGYFMFTDGESLIVTELNDPFSIDPLKYGSSEADPDPVVGLLKYRGEAYVFNRNTIEVFNNTGSTGFPFTRIPGGVIPKGAVGTHAKCLYADTFAWVGSGRNEAVSVYIQSAGSPQKIATREVEIRLEQYTAGQLAQLVMEAKTDRFHQHLMLHLPGETMVYDIAASQVVGEPVWFFLSTGVDGINAYRARHFVRAFGRWIVGDTQDGRLGYLDDTTALQYGEVAGRQFDTLMLYNEGAGALVHSLEIVGTTGRADLGEEPVAFLSYTADGMNWSAERSASIGLQGQTTQRVQWRRLGRMRHMRGIRVRESNGTLVAWNRMEAGIEPLGR